MQTAISPVFSLNLSSLNEGAHDMRHAPWAMRVHSPTRDKPKNSQRLNTFAAAFP